MKKEFLLLVLSISVLSITAFGQKRTWVRVPTPDEAYFGVQYLVTSSIKRPSPGNVVFLNKMGHTTTQFEVNCVEHKFRRLRETESAWLSNGMLIPAAPVQGTFPTAWDTIVNDGSIISALAKRVCSADKPTPKKKPVKKKVK
jgi:hypothetical protein